MRTVRLCARTATTAEKASRETILLPTVYMTFLLKIIAPAAMLSPPISAASSIDMLPTKVPVILATLLAPRAKEPRIPITMARAFSVIS